MNLLMKGRATASRRAVFRGRTSRQSEDALTLPLVDRSVNTLLQLNSIKRGRFLFSYPINGYGPSVAFRISFFRLKKYFYNFSLTTYT